VRQRCRAVQKSRPRATQGDPNPFAVESPTQLQLLLGQVPDKPTKLDSAVRSCSLHRTNLPAMNESEFQLTRLSAYACCMQALIAFCRSFATCSCPRVLKSSDVDLPNAVLSATK